MDNGYERSLGIVPYYGENVRVLSRHVLRLSIIDLLRTYRYTSRVIVRVQISLRVFIGLSVLLKIRVLTRHKLNLYFADIA